MTDSIAAPDAVPASTDTAAAPRGSVWEVLAVATRLGLTSFGGPVAHIGYFRDEYVARRRWIDEETFADLVALSQTLPGPASSKLGMSIGILRAGLPGGVAAWIGFTAPSAVALTVFALVAQQIGDVMTPWVAGLKIVAVAVIAQALWGMARALTPDTPRASIAIIAAASTIVWPTQWVPAAASQVIIIVVAGVVGVALLQTAPVAIPARQRAPLPGWLAVVAATVFVGLLIALPVARQVTDVPGIALFDAFYRTGALVFGGGHVVLPLLDGEVVRTGWVSPQQFLAGYGAAQAVPGPLFTFSAYLGAINRAGPDGVVGALVALIGIFLPGALIVVATLPSWGALRSRPAAQGALRGINAAVVGLLLAALYQSAWVPTITGPGPFALALVAFGALTIWKLPSWLVVVAMAGLGAVAAPFLCATC